MINRPVCFGSHVTGSHEEHHFIIVKIIETFSEFTETNTRGEHEIDIEDHSELVTKEMSEDGDG